VRVTVIATGIKPDKLGMRARTAGLSPALRTAQQSVKSMMLKKEKLPIETAATHVTSEIPADDLDVPAFIRRRKPEQP
jgi:hypothetical protein